MSDMKVTGISVNGKGFFSAVPDIGYVDLYVRCEGMALEEAITEARRKTGKIVDVIKSGVSEVKDITVTDVQIGAANPSSRNLKESPKPEVIKNILVVIPPVSDIAVKIVDLASRMGASLENPLANLSAGDPCGVFVYGLLSHEKVEEAAIKKAIEDAQKKAVKTAKVLGKAIGRVLNVSEVEISGTGSGARAMVMKKKLGTKFSTDYLSVSPESVEVSVSLMVSFEMVEEKSRKVAINF